MAEGKRLIKFKKINFGQASAEQESTYYPELLLRGFFDPWNVVEASIEGPKSLFLGYKGSGKSAIGEHLRLLSEEKHSLFVRHSFLMDFPYGNFAKIVSGEGAPESRFPSAWTWILLLCLMESFSKDEGAKSARDNGFVSAIQSLKEVGLLPDGDLNRIVVASSKPKIKAKLTSVFEFEMENTNSQFTDLDFLKTIDKLKNLALSFESNSKHLLVIDGLDDILLQSEIQYQSLAALILEFTRLNAEFVRNQVPAKIIVLCRTELYERLPGPNKNKIRQDSAIELDWYHNPRTPESSNLIHLVNNRATLSDPEIKSLFIQYFPREMGNKPILFYLLEHTRHTPRDLIQLLTNIQSCTRRDFPTPHEVHAGARNYSSKYMLPEIKDELVGYLDTQQIDQLLGAISRINKFIFSMVEISNELKGSKLLREKTLTSLLDLLFQCSAIGNVSTDSRNIRHFSFKYRNRHAFFNQEQDIAVHRGLWLALKITTRSDN